MQARAKACKETSTKLKGAIQPVEVGRVPSIIAPATTQSSDAAEGAQPSALQSPYKTGASDASTEVTEGSRPGTAHASPEGAVAAPARRQDAVATEDFPAAYEGPGSGADDAYGELDRLLMNMSSEELADLLPNLNHDLQLLHQNVNDHRS